jgi:hypothetical protein
VLESIDPNVETPDTFAIKLAMRTRTSLPRVRQVVRGIPCAIKQGVSVGQANALKSILEEIGGRARLESYLVTPGVDDPPPKSVPVRLGYDDVEDDVVELRNCVACGGPLEDGSESCPVCRDQTSPERGVEENEAPVVKEATETVVETERPRVDLVAVLRENKFLVAAGILAILLAISIIKQ